MSGMHDLMAGIGYCVSIVGVVTLVILLIGLCIDYWWRKWLDFDAFLRVCDVAKKNGIKLTRRKA